MKRTAPVQKYSYIDVTHSRFLQPKLSWPDFPTWYKSYLALWPSAYFLKVPKLIWFNEFPKSLLESYSSVVAEFQLYQELLDLIQKLTRELKSPGLLFIVKRGSGFLNINIFPNVPNTYSACNVNVNVTIMTIENMPKTNISQKGSAVGVLAI